jgi:hypothetical protein
VAVGCASTTRAPPPRRTGWRRCHAGRAELRPDGGPNPRLFPRLPKVRRRAGKSCFTRDQINNSAWPTARGRKPHGGFWHGRIQHHPASGLIREAGSGDEGDARVLADLRRWRRPENQWTRTNWRTIRRRAGRGGFVLKNLFGFRRRTMQAFRTAAVDH